MENRQGFRALTPEQRRELASKAGRASQDSGHGHRWTYDEAIEAGRAGGFEKQRRRRKRQGIKR